MTQSSADLRLVEWAILLAFGAGASLGAESWAADSGMGASWVAWSILTSTLSVGVCSVINDQAGIEFSFGFRAKEHCRWALVGASHCVVLHCFDSACLVRHKVD